MKHEFHFLNGSRLQQILVTHTTKLNAGNPTDSLETQSIKVLCKIEFLSPDELTVVKINKRKLFIILQ